MTRNNPVAGGPVFEMLEHRLLLSGIVDADGYSPWAANVGGLLTPPPAQNAPQGGAQPASVIVDPGGGRFYPGVTIHSDQLPKDLAPGSSYELPVNYAEYHPGRFEPMPDFIVVSWTDVTVYASASGKLDSSQVLLGSDSGRNYTSAWGTYGGAVLNIPADMAPGDYYLVATFAFGDPFTNTPDPGPAQVGVSENMVHIGEVSTPTTQAAPISGAPIVAAPTPPPPATIPTAPAPTTDVAANASPSPARAPATTTVPTMLPPQIVLAAGDVDMALAPAPQANPAPSPAPPVDTSVSAPAGNAAAHGQNSNVQPAATPLPQAGDGYVIANPDTPPTQPITTDGLASSGATLQPDLTNDLAAPTL